MEPVTIETITYENSFTKQKNSRILTNYMIHVVIRDLTIRPTGQPDPQIL
jgi:hypothetical protein